jgi:NhaP-type Na+/H+ or K+/H+ antiporter
LLSFAVWFLFGAVLLPLALHSVGWQIILFSVLALTVLRMIPVALASFGIGEPADAVTLVGWLGPRGLASIVFALLVIEQLPAGAADPVIRVIALTVGISVLAHGLTAGPLAGWYARRIATSGSGRPSEPTIDGDAASEG